ncbi:MAG TPA: hypothetical protein EYG92_02115 [Lutibacter sp.]|nr:hypothetical protein [Lutibacter sp.]
MKLNKTIFGKIALVLILMLAINSCADKTCDYEGGADVDEEFPYACESGMDVAFLIDYTASMGGAIDGIKSSVSSIVSTIVNESGGDYRLSLSIFDETMMEGDVPFPTGYSTQVDYTSLPAAQKVVNTTGTNRAQYLTMMEKFGTANQASFGTQLAKLNAAMSLGSGVGFPEPGGLLLNEVLNNSFAGTWRTGSITKLAIIITDATAGGDDDTADGVDNTDLANLAATANAMGVQCILITSMSAGTNNYEISLIDNNDESIKITGADFSNIADDIIIMIEGICDNNENIEG